MNKAKWLEALRSGNYQQGKHQLRYGDTFCCLGVYCDIRNPGGWEADGDCGNYKFNYELGTSYMNLPVDYRRELGMDADTMFKLMEMNDKGTPFSEIADYIEANL